MGIHLSVSQPRDCQSKSTVIHSPQNRVHNELGDMNTTDLRILLWDIDGTVLRSTKAITFTEYTRPVLEAVFGTAGRIDQVPLTGITDLQYIAESLSCEGITREVIFERMGEISARYFCEIERAASNGPNS